jgi:hypothetical protein
MTTEHLIQQIEEGPVHADLTLASTTYTLLRRLELNPIIVEARRRSDVDPDALRRYFDRAVALFEKQGPEGYTHPDDLALCAYISILARDPKPAAQGFVNRVASAKRPEFPAATAVAEYFTSRIPSTTSGEGCEPAAEFYSLTGKTIVVPEEVHGEERPAHSSDQLATNSGQPTAPRSDFSGVRLVA